MDYKMDFENYWAAMRPAAKYDNRKESARQEWNAHPQKHAAIMTWLKRHGAYPDRNPYFFIQDFKARQQTMSFDDYYKKYGTTEETDGWRRVFLPDKQTTIYVKN